MIPARTAFLASFTELSEAIDVPAGLLSALAFVCDWRRGDPPTREQWRARLRSGIKA